jgi:hypothetical protein
MYCTQARDHEVLTAWLSWSLPEQVRDAHKKKLDKIQSLTESAEPTHPSWTFSNFLKIYMTFFGGVS